MEKPHVRLMWTGEALETHGEEKTSSYVSIPETHSTIQLSPLKPENHEREENVYCFKQLCFEVSLNYIADLVFLSMSFIFYEYDTFFKS
jgi:hypothetical protein